MASVSLLARNSTATSDLRAAATASAISTFGVFGGGVHASEIIAWPPLFAQSTRMACGVPAVRCTVTELVTPGNPPPLLITVAPSRNSLARDRLVRWNV
jgi:hypothetical protein